MQICCIVTLHGITMFTIPYVKTEDKLLYRARLSDIIVGVLYKMYEFSHSAAARQQ
jgi:hypothetical protein